jgi:hypothetical protein
LIRNVFRWLALLLLAYVGAAFFARPDLMEVMRGTLIPSIRFDREFLTLIVAAERRKAADNLSAAQQSFGEQTGSDEGRH